MKINTKLSVATHIVLCIAFFENEGTTSNLIAKSVKTNPAIIRRILLKLQDAEIVETTKKGSKLIKDEKDITLLSIYKAVFTEEERGLFNFHHPNHVCPVGCAMFDVLGEEFNNVREDFEKSLSKITIKKIADEVRKKKKAFGFYE
ncbi:Rrf2 family transcriptional regulator [Brachyspira pilosicoli P43/6/78]|uniref:Rrf2 family transcriptional regulator n=1 Tax=Brachyspira pilosicoli P43/6/78 TaxID=1042417 RepID=A0A3B6VLX3_BRAPL|nr:Rrf2 family transcriptional regulator [Brachyspira pilosicoli]AGA66144.1 Rrf2 family transcriptional regulator [Brachyspira pilosicoli P43/6/78]